MTRAALLLIITGCILPIWFYLGAYPWSQTVKMAAVCLGLALAFTGLAMLVGRDQ